MNLLLQRQWFTDQSTCGELSFEGGAPALTLFTLEPPKPKCIPQGGYKAIIAPSEKFGRNMPRLLSVPGWPNDDVLIHWGNYPDDTEGCIMVGLEHDTDFIGNSREAFGQLYPLLLPAAAAGDLTITVVG